MFDQFCLVCLLCQRRGEGNVRVHCSSCADVPFCWMYIDQVELNSCHNVSCLAAC